MKILRWVLIILAALVLLFVFVGMPYLKEQTKKNSPERIATYSENGLDLEVKYSSPFKKGRIIFGELVPYNVVWRTGANEPTTFSTKTDLQILGNYLPTGTYSLWTIPGPENWKVMFNKKVPDWGVTLISGGRETTRDAENDMFQVEVPVMGLDKPVESFTIDFEDIEELYLTLTWDKTKVRIPIRQ
ncbi:MAG: DUF2911 domain-containing protein [Eudoraea sp.]|nr:DUF2911 domain-containing protein [Eudoraea sp.]MBT8209175.1 DUF2911 domain-containing protein [Eudoraea sp.]